MEQSRCEDAPCCGHRACGFGPGVPGYGSIVGGVPYYGEDGPAVLVVGEALEVALQPGGGPPTSVGEVHDDTPMFCDRPSCMTVHAPGACLPDHDCMENAVPYTSDGALGHGFECGVCGAFIQAG